MTSPECCAAASAQRAVAWADSGENAEPEDSGGNYLFLSPGISVMVARNVQLFAIAQLPLYQYVNGVS